MKLNPSQAQRWVPCPGSAYMESLYPRTTTHPVTEEGKAIHWACEGVLFSWSTKNDITPKTLVSYIGQTCPENGLIITEDFVAAGNVYLACVWERAQQYPDGLAIEKQASAYHAGLELAGRIDARWINETKTWLTVWDAKFGYKPVTAFENWQLLIYGIAEAYPTIETVELVVVQPRGLSVRQPVKRWMIDRPTLARYQAIIAQSKAEAELREGAPTRPGSHCRNCQAAHSCPALEEASWHAHDTAGISVPQDLTPKEIAYRLDEFERAQEMLRARRDALEALATRHIQHGTIVPGFKLHVSLGDRQWRQEQDAVGLGLLSDVEMYERKMISPKQAEVRGIPPQAVEALTVRYERPPKLTRDKA